METDRRRQGTDRREQILDRTLELVREGGLAGLTIRRIAERVGFTEAAIYRHWPSKKALLAGLVDRLEEMLLGPIRALAEDTEKDPRERLEKVLAHHQRVILETDSLPILLLAEVVATRDEELVDRMRSVLASYLALLEDLLGQARRRGERLEAPALPPRDAVLLLLGLPAALAIRHRLIPQKDPGPRKRRNLTRAVVAAAIGTGGLEGRP